MTTTTKTIREVQYIGPDGQPLDFIPDGGGQLMYDNGGMADYQNYQMYHQAGMQPYPNRPPTPPTPSERSNSSPLPNHRVPGKVDLP